MKIQRSIFWFVAIVAALIMLVLWFGKKQPVTSSAETNATPPLATTPGQPVSAPVHTNTPPAQVAANALAPRPNKGEQIKEGLATLNDVPIAFYGRLEDQFGSPVVGAQIAASIRIYNGVQSTVERSSVTSDANGFFQVKGGKGESLGIMPKKEGYVLATTSTYFKYSYMYADHFTPDPNNPTVIKMWKLHGAEPLVGINQNYKLHYANTPINFDLLTGKIVPAGGDLKITVNRPAGNVSEHNPQDWGFAIEVINGGLMETSSKESAISFVAPENGYEQSDTLSASSNRHGVDVIQQNFFVQSRNGQVYSKLAIAFRINDTPDGFMYITFSGVANTNGSRNWEATVPQ
ncbi:MAG: hypothetical protein ABSH15_04590 [Verrucomicrobiota bacterium]|jgi:hypothetical protein